MKNPFLPETLLIGRVDEEKNCIEPGFELRGSVGIGLWSSREVGAVLTGGHMSLAHPLAQPLPLKMTGCSRSSTESHGLQKI